MVMGFKDKIDAVLGVYPPDVLKRITVALISVIIVMAVDILILLGKSLGIVNQIPFLNDQIVSIIIVSSLLFSFSLIYYVILPGTGKGEAYT
jgi:hypothetical protein